MLRKQVGSRASVPRRARSTRYLPLVVTWQIVVVLVAALAVQRQVWSIAAAGAVLLVALLLTIPVNGRTLWSTIGIRRRFARRRRTKVEAPDHAPDLVPVAQWLPRLELTQIKDAHDEEIGVVADGESWSGLLEVTADAALFSDRGAKLDLASLDALTQHDDVVFAGIQVVTMTVPAPSGAMLPAGSPAMDAYRELVTGPVPPALRRTWVALRLDPRLCLEAVARRGSGQEGVFATLRFGLHRAQATLKRLGVVTEPLDPMGIAAVLGLTSGSSPEPGERRTAEEGRLWQCDALVHETREVRRFGPSLSQAYQLLLDAVAEAPAIMAFTSVTVSPGQNPRGAVRLVTASLEQAIQADEEVVARVDGHLRLGPLGGVQVPGMLATIPLGRQVG